VLSRSRTPLGATVMVPLALLAKIWPKLSSSVWMKLSRVTTPTCDWVRSTSACAGVTKPIQVSDTAAQVAKRAIYVERHPIPQLLARSCKWTVNLRLPVFPDCFGPCTAGMYAASFRNADGRALSLADSQLLARTNRTARRTLFAPLMDSVCHTGLQHWLSVYG